MADLPGIPEMLPDKGLQIKRDQPRLASSASRELALKNPSADLCCKGLTIISGGADLDDDSTLYPCDPAQAVQQLDLPLVAHLFLEISSTRLSLTR